MADTKCTHAQSIAPYCTFTALCLQAVLHLHGLQQLSQQPVQLDSFDWLQHQPVSNDSCSPCNNGDDQPQQSSPLQLQTAQRQGMHSQLQHQLQEVHEQHQQDSGSSAVGVDPKALALLLTAARVLFCAGALQTALQLLQLCAPAEQAAAAHQPLHLSSIRNEAAYAALIRKLLSVEALPAAAVCEGGRGRQQVLYVCGDSHTLSRESAGARQRSASARVFAHKPVACSGTAFLQG